MQFWVPAPLRDELDPSKLYDTSHQNQTTDNHMGTDKSGKVLENGMDHWWDDQGNGNCWENNHYADGHQDDNFVLPPRSCAAGGSRFLPGLFVKDAGFLTCSQYDRDDPILRHPPRVRRGSTARPSRAAHAGCGRTPPPSEPTRRPVPRVPLLGLTGGLALHARCRPPASPPAVPACCVGSCSWSGLLLLIVAGGGVAVARSTPSLSADGSDGGGRHGGGAGFQVANRTIRQVRYVDGGTLRYTFRVHNDGRLPVTVLGLAEDQADSRLFTITDLSRSRSAAARPPRSPCR